MTPEQFCYWLNGFGELTADAPTSGQWKAIKEHLETVFTKVTPSAPGYLGNDPRRLGQVTPQADTPSLLSLALRVRKEAQALAADREANRIKHPFGGQHFGPNPFSTL